jgi:drug/metabolite transporter (DMT)-like permease
MGPILATILYVLPLAAMVGASVLILRDAARRTRWVGAWAGLFAVVLVIDPVKVASGGLNTRSVVGFVTVPVLATLVLSTLWFLRRRPARR